MALRDCLNPPSAVGAVAELVDLDAYYAKAPDALIPPYLLIGYAPQVNPIDGALDGVPTTFSDDMYVTLVSDTPGNVEVLRDQVRQAINPSNAGRLVARDGKRFWIKRATEFTTPVRPDTTSSKLPLTGDHPYYAMDTYRVYTH